MNFGSVKVLCVGDVMLDRYIHGDISRISPEAPVPVMRMTETREMVGGAGNVANNITALGGYAVLLSLLGEDLTGCAIRRIVGGIPAITPEFVATPFRPTICKTRFVAARQQIVRTDDESLLPLQPSEEDLLVAAFDAHIGYVNALILSDYGKGLLSEKILQHTISSARSKSVPVFVDPKTKYFARYKGSTCITPNLKELADATNMTVETEAAVEKAARSSMVSASSEAILVTRSEHGMMLVPADGVAVSVPARAREVFDVSGAGDTVIAAMTLSFASGMSLTESMRVANAAAGVVVSKLGTATASVAEVLHELEEQDRDTEIDIPGVVSAARTAELVRRWKQLGLKVGFANGCFDILHPGHVSLLKAARAQCDRLVVALNSDTSVRRLKGLSRPINDLHARGQVIAGLRYVDCVIGFEDDTPIELIRQLLPDVLVKGSDYTLATVVGADIVQSAGGRVYLADLVPGKSTTKIIERLHTKPVTEPALP